MSSIQGLTVENSMENSIEFSNIFPYYFSSMELIMLLSDLIYSSDLRVQA
jgi:hypothetical protein